MLLTPIGWLYGKIADLRNTMYDRGTFKSYDLGARTISIGNITTGGTGKTPLVAYVSGLLSESGEKVCVLTRGYGRKSSGRVLVSDGSNVLVDAEIAGDEPVELARKLIGKAIVIADGDRVSASRWAVNEFGVTAFVLDDGFQHRRARRDLDIVCIDASNPFDNDSVLPAGRLRERITNLHRANVLVITRTELVDDLLPLQSRLTTLNPEAPVFLSQSRIGNSTEIDRAAFAFCALGNPAAFFELLKRTGCRLAGTRTFADHHDYSQDEVVQLGRAAREAGAEVLLTTAKDMVKLERFKTEIPIQTVELRIELDKPDDFRRLVTSS